MAKWKLVPVEPAKSMKDACDLTPGPMTAWMAWEVMTTASPDPRDDRELIDRLERIVSDHRRNLSTSEHIAYAILKELYE